jgi:hypothetical protein
MYAPSTIRRAAMAAIALCLCGIAISIVNFNRARLTFLSGIISWSLLLWAAYLGLRLSSYKLYPEEYKKVGIRVYLIIVAFILFLFLGLVVGLILSVILLGSLWALKSNYDDWEGQDSPPQL